MTHPPSLPGSGMLTASSAVGILLIFFANTLIPLPIVTQMGRWSEFLVVLAVVLMIWSILTLGRMMFTAGPPAHLVTHGLYRYSRHPFYLSLILGFTGLALASNNWIALGAALMIIMPVQILRALREERQMAAHFGEEWDFYKARTAFMIPGLW